MELPACRFGKPLGFTEKQVMGPLLTHKTIPSHKHKSSKQLLHHVHLRTSTEHQWHHRRPTDHNDKTWKHPGEYGRAQAWLKRTMRDLEMERDVHGHQPPVIFANRAEMHIDIIPAIPAPAGMPAPTPNTGEACVRQSGRRNSIDEKVDKFYTLGRRRGGGSAYHDGATHEPGVYR
jgi:hypothetical protein